MKRMERKYFIDKTSNEMARLLLGNFIVKITSYGVIVAKIIETEAYFGTVDKASSAYGGIRKADNNILYGDPGYLYIWNVDKLYKAFTIVTGAKDNPSYVLIRKVEVLEGFDAASIYRFKKKYNELTSKEKKEIGCSTSKVVSLLNLSEKDTGIDLCSESSILYLSHNDTITKMFNIVQEERLICQDTGEFKSMPWRYIYEESDEIDKSYIGYVDVEKLISEKMKKLPKKIDVTKDN